MTKIVILLKLLSATTYAMIIPQDGALSRSPRDLIGYNRGQNNALGRILNRQHSTDDATNSSSQQMRERLLIFLSKQKMENASGNKKLAVENFAKNLRKMSKKSGSVRKNGRRGRISRFRHYHH